MHIHTYAQIYKEKISPCEDGDLPKDELFKLKSAVK